MNGSTMIILLSVIFFVSFTFTYMHIQSKKPSTWTYETRFESHDGPDMAGLPVLLGIFLMVFNTVLFLKLDNTENYTYLRLETDLSTYSKQVGLTFLELENPRSFQTKEVVKEDGTIAYQKINVNENPIYLHILNGRYYFFLQTSKGRYPVYLGFDKKYAYEFEGENELEIIVSQTNEFEVEVSIKQFKNKFVDWYYGKYGDKKIKVVIPEKNTLKQY